MVGDRFKTSGKEGRLEGEIGGERDGLLLGVWGVELDEVEMVMVDGRSYTASNSKVLDPNYDGTSQTNARKYIHTYSQPPTTQIRQQENTPPYPIKSTTNLSLVIIVNTHALPWQYPILFPQPPNHGFMNAESKVESLLSCFYRSSSPDMENRQTDIQVISPPSRFLYMLTYNGHMCVRKSERPRSCWCKIIPQRRLRPGQRPWPYKQNGGTLLVHQGQPPRSYRR